MIVSDSVKITLDKATPHFTLVPADIGKQTAKIALRLRRPTTAQPLEWPKDAVIKTEIVLVIDGVELRCHGQASGGIRFNDRAGVEHPEYRLAWSPPLDVSEEDTKRLGERATSVKTYVELSLIGGESADLEVTIDTIEEVAPIFSVHHSVAYDNASSIEETTPDGTIGFDHVSTGSNLAAVIIRSAYHIETAETDWAATYGGTSTTELIDTQLPGGGTQHHAIWIKGGFSAGTQAVSSTTVSGDVSSFVDWLFCVTCTGVDQADMNRTVVTASGAGTTVTSPSTGAITGERIIGAAWALAPTTPTGTNHIERAVQEAGGAEMSVTTRPGQDGNTVTWTCGDFDWAVLALALKAGATSVTLPSKPIRALQAVHRAASY